MAGNNNNLGRMTISVNLDSTEFTNGLDNINRSLKTAKSDAKAQIAYYDSIGDKMGSMTARLKGLNDQYELSARKQDELKRRYDQAVRTYGEASTQAQKYARQLNDVSRDMSTLERKIREGEDAIEDFSRELQDAEKKSTKFKNAMDKAGDKIHEFGERMEKVSQTAGVMAGAIAGIGIGAAKMAAEAETHLTKLTNAFGVSGEEAEALKKTAMDVWSEGFGESLEEAVEAVRIVKQNLTELNDVDLTEATKKISLLAETFDADVSEVSRGINGMMTNFGLSFEEASDMTARAAQLGLDRSKELFDNLAEYSSLFSSMGYEADEMFNVLIGGMKEGAYNLDFVNDAYKEFGIRIKDGSDKTTKAMGSMSKETQDLWKKMLDGKATAADVSAAVIQELMAMDDQTKAGQTGVELFGTKWEDLEDSVMYATQNGIDYIGDYNGAMDDMLKNTEETMGVQFKRIMREAQEALIPLGKAFLDMADKYLPKIEEKLKTIQSIWNELSSEEQGAIVKGVGWLTAGLGAVALIGTLAKIVGSLAKSVGTVGSLLLSALGLKGKGGSGRGGGGTPPIVAGGGRSNRNGQGTGGMNSNRRQNGSANGQRRSTRGNLARAPGKMAKGAGLIGLVFGGGAILNAIFSKTDTKEEKGEKVGGTTGATAGALVGAKGGGSLGAMIGTAIAPGIGTAIGGALGAMAGGFAGMVGFGELGEKIGGAIGRGLDKDNQIEKELKKKLEEIQNDPAIKKGVAIDFKIKGVSKATQDALQTYENFYKSAKNRMETYLDQERVINQERYNKLKADEQKLTSATNTQLDKRYERQKNQIKKSKVLSDKEKEQALAALNKRYNGEKAAVKENESTVLNILNTAKKEKRALTQGEVNVISEIRRDGYERHKRLASKGEKETTAITKNESKKRTKDTIKDLNDRINRAKTKYKEEKKAATDAADSKIADAKLAYEELGTISKKEYKAIVREANKTKDDSIGKAKEKRDKVVNTARRERDELQKTARNQAKKVAEAKAEEKKQVEKYANLQKRISEERARSTKDGVVNSWQQTANQVVSAVNKVVSFFGFKKQWNLPFPGAGNRNLTGSEHRSSKAGGGSIPKDAYAKGTYMGKHRGGPAIVGEEGYELAYTPKAGMGLVGVGGQTVMDLPKGSAVLPHDKTKRLLGGGADPTPVLQKYNFPAFAKGTGDDGFFESAIKFTKKAWGGLKSIGSNAAELAMGGFGKVWEKFGGKVDFENQFKLFPKDEVLNFFKKLAKGPIENAIDKLLQFKSEEEEAMAADFHFDGDLEKDPNKVGPGSAPSGLMKYVYQIYKDNIASRFKVKGIGGYSNRNMVGGSSKSVHSYGRAIDIFATPSEMSKIANFSKDAPLPLLQYVIYNRKWAKAKGAWGNYMTSPGRNPHTDHVHVDFKPPTKANLEKLVGDNYGSGVNVSGGAKAWTSQIKKAHKAIYGTEISKNGLAEVLEQIQTESGGNAKIKQGIIDINSFNGTGGAKGLLQFIDPTFNNYKLRGYGDIWNGYHQLLALFNVKEWFAAITRAGRGRGWSPRGPRVKPYADGGFITQPHLGLVGEDGPESIIPLDKAKRGRALQLLRRTASVLGAEVVNKRTEEVRGTDHTALIAQLVAQNNQLMETLISVVDAKNLNIGDKAIFDANKRQLEKETRRTSFQRGL